MNKKSKPVIRKGDRVKIITPEVFLRCGYPMSVSEETERIKREHSADIYEMMRKLGLTGTYALTLYKELAYVSCKQKNFGGRERKIYTYPRPDLQDQIGVVEDKRVVKTGEYVPTWGYEEDYNPPQLTQAKSHVILRLSVENYAGSVLNNFYGEIEAKNVEKLI